MSPNTREDDLMISRVDDELVIFDQRTEEYHHLNSVATFIWDRCDGETDVGTLADQLGRAFEMDSPRPLIEEALVELSEADLLEESAPERDQTGDNVNRRTALLKMAATGAAVAALPLVKTMAAPPAAEARSPASGSGGGGSTSSGGSDSDSSDRGLQGGASGDRGGSSWWKDFFRWFKELTG